MFKPALNKDFYNRLGTYIFIGSLVFYFLLKLPFNLSVLCSSQNEGFYFIWGQHYLNGLHFHPPERPCLTLLILVYALVLKLFGFGTWSIIVVHFIQTFIVIMIGILMFLICKTLFTSEFYVGLAVLVWILVQLTPIGGWGLKHEFESAFTLEAEYFIVLFSLLSFFSLLKAIQGTNAFLLSVLAGLFASMPIMFKASGGVLLIAYMCWLVYLTIFKRELIKKNSSNLFCLFGGMLLGLLLFNLGIYLYKVDLVAYWHRCFDVGVYSDDAVKSAQSFVSSIHMFLRRDVSSTVHNAQSILSNLLLLGISLFGMVFIGLRSCFTRSSNPSHIFIVLISIWSFGNICAVIAPGGYGAYYYILVWVPVSIFLILLIQDIFNYFPSVKFLKILVFGLVIVFFIHRLYLVTPALLNQISESVKLNMFYQPESFEDPVTRKEKNPNRVYYVPIVADLINSFIPNKKDTVYILDLPNSKAQAVYFPITMYVYMKRLCSTTAVSEYFSYKQYIDNSIELVKKDFLSMPPKIIVLPHSVHLQDWHLEKMKLFLNWLNSFLLKNYHIKTEIQVNDSSSNGADIYAVYERN